MHTSLKPLGECHCWWTRVSPRANVAKFNVRLQLIRSFLRASKFSVLKFIEIVILWIYYMASLLAPASFGTFVTSLLNFLNYFVWLRITDEGSVPEMRIWPILLMKSDLKWCIDLGLFYISTISLTWWVSLLVDQRVPDGKCSQVLRSTSVDS